MLAPQKNRAGQRVYRKRDVEIALRIKELLYEDQYTIAGAKKRLANDLRAGGKLKIISSNDSDESTEQPLSERATGTRARTDEERKALKKVSTELRELLAMLDAESRNSKPH
jgi:DNA-binding transcriptional MerR regulator